MVERSAANPQSTGYPNPSEIWQPASRPVIRLWRNRADRPPKATLSLATSLILQEKIC